MDLVEDVDLCDVGVWASIPRRGRADGEGCVFVGEGDGGVGDSDELVGLCAYAGPGVIDKR